jgi:hypothetical protein
MRDEVRIVYTRWYNADLKRLPESSQAIIEKTIALLEEKGWEKALIARLIAPLQDGIYELRVNRRGAAFRILFFLAPGRTPQVVVLTTCAAKSEIKKRHRMNAEIKRAKERRAMWLEQQNQ